MKMTFRVYSPYPLLDILPLTLLNNTLFVVSSEYRLHYSHAFYGFADHMALEAVIPELSRVFERENISIFLQAQSVSGELKRMVGDVVLPRPNSEIVRGYRRYWCESCFGFEYETLESEQADHVAALLLYEWGDEYDIARMKKTGVRHG